MRFAVANCSSHPRDRQEEKCGSLRIFNSAVAVERCNIRKNFRNYSLKEQSTLPIRITATKRPTIFEFTAFYVRRSKVGLAWPESPCSRQRHQTPAFPGRGSPESPLARRLRPTHAADRRPRHSAPHSSSARRPDQRIQTGVDGQAQTRRNPNGVNDASSIMGGGCWRRRRDSNPRYPLQGTTI